MWIALPLMGAAIKTLQTTTQWSLWNLETSSTLMRVQSLAKPVLLEHLKHVSKALDLAFKGVTRLTLCLLTDPSTSH